MINTGSLDTKLAIDTKSVGDLKQAAREKSPEAVKAAAKQFEALFTNMMLKSMRDASPQDGLFDNDQSRMYTSMLDQQISQKMASRGIGLADVLVRQLSGGVNADATNAVDGAAQPDTSVQADAAPIRTASRAPHVQNFVDKLAAHAQEASRSTGIPAKFMLGQAALESGWGKREIAAADGTKSHNLFGIKAGASWKGKVVQAVTTEYVNGKPHTKVEKFRAYDSYADAFRDYANLLRGNPRYQGVLANAGNVAGFAQGLQKAGYASDPHYAAKLTRIINHTLSA